MTTDTRDAVRRLIRAEIEAAGLRQVTVAAAVGITQKHLSQIVTGKAWPSPELLDDILAACGRRLAVTTVPADVE